MQPQYPTYKQPSRKKLFIVAVLLVFAVSASVVATIMRKHNATKPLFTPPKTTTTQQSTNVTNTTGPTFSYPKGWKDVSAPGSKTITIAYVVNGVTYKLNVSPPAQINPEGGANITDTSSTVTYNGRSYTRTIWSKDGKPFYMTAIPAQNQSDTVYVLSMDLPPTDTDRYIATFDQIAGTLSY
jgi:hypothetical protein